MYERIRERVSFIAFIFVTIPPLSSYPFLFSPLILPYLTLLCLSLSSHPMLYYSIFPLYPSHPLLPYSAPFYLFLSSYPTLPSSSIFDTAASESLHLPNNLLILLLSHSVSADNLVFLSLPAHCTPPLFSQFQPVFIDYLLFRLPKDDDIGVDIIKAINGKIF